MTIAKAIAATLAPLALPIAHAIGLTEVTLPGLELLLLGVFTGAMTWLVPNKTT